MAWFSDLAGKAENLLNNLDEQTGAALRKRNGVVLKKRDTAVVFDNASNANKRRPPSPPIRRSKSPPLPPASATTLPIRSKSPPIKKPVKFQPESFSIVSTIPVDTEVSHSSDYDYKPRRNSFPKGRNVKINDLLEYAESLEVENKVLKNELEQSSKDLTALVVKMESMESDLKVARKKQIESETQKDNLCSVNKRLATQLEIMENQAKNLTSEEINKLKHVIHEMEEDIERKKAQSEELGKQVEQLKTQCSEKNKANEKLETDLRNANSKITTLSSDLEKANADLKRIEKEWDSYKLRSKSTLCAKDRELKSLQEGVFLSEDAKSLMQEIVNLKKERDILQEDVDQMRVKCDELKKYVNTSEGRFSATERMVSALREAFKDERAARNRVEAQFSALTKDLKTIQQEASQKITAMRAQLREKERELEQLRETMSFSATSDTSALNVADYESKEMNAENEKVQDLSEKLIQRQTKIDSLIADNNALRIQLQNIETRYQRELQLLKHQAASSVVSLYQDESKQRFLRRSDYGPDSVIDKVTRRFAVWMRSHPLFKAFIIIYVISLQVWVLAVLFTSTPDNPLSKPN